MRKKAEPRLKLKPIKMQLMTPFTRIKFTVEVSDIKATPGTLFATKSKTKQLEMVIHFLKLVLANYLEG